MGQCLKPKHQRQKHRSYQYFRRKTKGGKESQRKGGSGEDGEEGMEWRRWSRGDGEEEREGRRWSGGDRREEMERRRWSGGDGAEEMERRCRGGNGAKLSAKFRSGRNYTHIEGVITFVRVKSQKMKAFGASFDESSPPLSAPRAGVRAMEQKNPAVEQKNMAVETAETEQLYFCPYVADGGICASRCFPSLHYHSTGPHYPHFRYLLPRKWHQHSCDVLALMLRLRALSHILRLSSNTTSGLTL